MNLKYLNIDDALAKLNDYKIKWGASLDRITNNWQHHGVVHLELQIGTGSLTIGWERFKKGHIAMYVHCMIPRHEPDVAKALSIMEEVLKEYPNIEVQYDGNYERNYNGGEGIGKIYDEFTHKMKATFKCKHPLNKIEIVLCEHRGTLKAKWQKTHMRSPIDYDFHFQKM